jgi:DNA gyrase subunit A
MGVVFARFAEDDRIIALAKNTERNLDAQDEDPDAAAPAESAPVSEEDGSVDE